MRRYPPRKVPAVPGGSGYSSRDRATQARFRKMLIQQAGGIYCQRCGAHGIPVQAHHDTPTTGRLLCDPCHTAADPSARRSST